MLTFPQMALGLSGFELTMANAPLVRGRPGDDPDRPRGRVRNVRLMLVVAAVVMSVFVLGAVFAVSLLVPEAGLRENGRPVHRARLPCPRRRTGRRAGRDAWRTLLGRWFGLLYDLNAVLILSMAGTSATIAFRGMVPHFLAPLRHGAAPGAKGRGRSAAVQRRHPTRDLRLPRQRHRPAVGLRHQRAGAVDERRGRGPARRGRPAARALGAPAGAAAVHGNHLLLAPHDRQPVRPVAGCRASPSRSASSSCCWPPHSRRPAASTEPRFEGFAFADGETKKRWGEICQIDFQVLAPHRPGPVTLLALEEDVRHKHRLAPGTCRSSSLRRSWATPATSPTSRSCASTKTTAARSSASRFASVAHVLASIALEFRRVGRPPELFFDWSLESPLAANLHFLLMGEGNIPWMVHELIRRAEPDAARRPRVVVG